MNKLNEVREYGEKTFEDIKHFDELGNEYWTARELQLVLEYKEWRNFEIVINKAKRACENSSNEISEHLVEVNKMSKRGNNTVLEIKDYHFSRYFCYLLVQNGDPRKEVIALGQTYFAIQTRKQEIFEQEYEMLSDDEKRLYKRNQTRNGNYTLQQTALKAGVKDMAGFHNAGYKGLYNGETADDIFKRKGLRYREDILDNMGEDELVANLFRINQTKQKIRNEKIQGETNAKDAHFQVGKKVREFISDNGGTMPEDLPTPEKSLKQLEKEQKQLKNKSMEKIEV